MIILMLYILICLIIIFTAPDVFCSLKDSFTLEFPQVQGGLFGPLQFFLPPSVLSRWHDSCRITPRLVTLVPKSFLDPLSLNTTHDKMLANSLVSRESHPHHLLSRFPSKKALFGYPSSFSFVSVPILFLSTPPHNALYNISLYSQALYPSS